MKSGASERNWALVTSPVLVLSLTLLVLNDWYFKAAFHNGLTGKLSDFAGILMVSLLGFALWPRRKGTVSAVIVVGFCYWKSPLSEPLLALLNTWGPYGFGRVVDYGDLAALVTVPLAWALANRAERAKPVYMGLRRVLLAPLLVLCLIAMVATTKVYPTAKFDARFENGGDGPDRAEIAKAIREVAKHHRLKIEHGQDPTRIGYYSQSGTTLEYVIRSDGSVRAWIQSRKTRRPERLAKTLKKALETLDAQSHQVNGQRSPAVEIVLNDYSSGSEISPYADGVSLLLAPLAGGHGMTANESGGSWHRSVDGDTEWISYRFEDSESMRLDVNTSVTGFAAALEEAFPGVEVYRLQDPEPPYPWSEYEPRRYFVDLQNVALAKAE